RHLAVVAREAHAAQVVAYRWYPQIFPWVLETPIAVADYRGELGSDGQHAPDTLWSREEFWRRWSSSEHLVVVLRRRNLVEFQTPGHRPARTLGENQKYIVLSNFTPSS